MNLKARLLKGACFLVEPKLSVKFDPKANKCPDDSKFTKLSC